jgi:transmembrane sensor
MSTPIPDHSPPLPHPTGPESAALNWFTRCQRGLTAEEETAFQDWLTADPRHAALFNEFDGTWNLLGRVAETTPLIAPAATPRPRWRSLVAPGAVAAAMVAAFVVYLGWWRPTHYAGETATAVGAIQRLQLPDGSVAFLNTDSAMKAAFTPAQRRVLIERGEVHFVVAKNPGRPFVAEAGGVAVRAVGTAFNIRLQPQGVDVLVTEGKVRVEDAASGRNLITPSTKEEPGPLANPGPPILTAGHRLTIPRFESAATPSPPPALLPPDEMTRALAWQQNRLEFESAPLAEIVAQFNRFNRHQLVVADPALAQQRFGGAFKPQDHAGLVRMLRQNFGVVADETEHATVLRAKP